MKNIIFLTDFSKNADSALSYLAEFSKTLPESNIYLIHTYAVATKTGMLMSVKDRIREDAKALLSARKRRFEELSDDRHYVFYKAIDGTLAKKVAQLERQLSADLIVTSMSGESDDPSNLIGPNAGSLIKETHVPLLLIPAGLKFKPFENITFALKSAKIQSANTVTILKDLFNERDPKLQVLIADLGKGEADIEDLHLNNIKFEVEHVEQESIYDAIMHNEKSRNADLITVIRRNRGFFERFFLTGSFKRSILDINVPLLVLRGAD